MAKILMFGNQKGGVGKSQCSIMTATAFSQPPFNLKTCIIDTDNQKSVVRIRNLDLKAYNTESAPFDVFEQKVADMQNKIGLMDKEYDIIIIDAAGKLDNDLPLETQEITKILMYVDCLFIPFVAGNHNLDATIDYFKFVRQVQNIRQLQSRNLKVCGFVNMHRSRSRANSFLLEDIDTIQASEELQMMKTTLNDYSLFRDADTMTSIYAPLSSDSSKANFSSFIDELIAIIQ